jgi:hypothetical protein
MGSSADPTSVDVIVVLFSCTGDIMCLRLAATCFQHHTQYRVLTARLAGSAAVAAMEGFWCHLQAFQGSRRRRPETLSCQPPSERARSRPALGLGVGCAVVAPRRP